MKLSVSNGIKLLLKRVYQKFTNGSRTKKSTPKGVSPLSVLLLFTLIVKYKKHNYFWWAVYPSSQVLTRSVSGTISDLKNNYAYYQCMLFTFILYYSFSSLSIFAFFILPLYKRLLIFEPWISYIEETYKY